MVREWLEDISVDLGHMYHTLPTPEAKAYVEYALQCVYDALRAERTVERAEDRKRVRDSFLHEAYGALAGAGARI